MKRIASMDDLSSAVPPPARDERADALAVVAKSFKLWRPAPEVLTTVRAVPTIFPQFDRATRVGGYPIERVNVVHGASSNGKTTFALGLGLSFLMAGHFYAHIDAEMTTPAEWTAKMMGAHARNPAFLAQRPSNYEEAIDAVRQLVLGIGEAKTKGILPADTSALVVVDSIRKLVPRDLLEKIRKLGADGLGGRAGQLKAAMNQAWLDDLTPMLYHTGTSVLMIARESDKLGADDDDRKYDNAWQVSGGKGLVYDSSLMLRISRASWVSVGSKEAKKIVGERLKIRIWKSKVESKQGKHAECYFHTSNGQLLPEGFDRARDVLELAIQYEIVKVLGTAYVLDGVRIGNGEAAAARYLTTDHPDELEALEALVRSRFRPDEALPEEVVS